MKYTISDTIKTKESVDVGNGEAHQGEITVTIESGRVTVETKTYGERGSASGFSVDDLETLCAKIKLLAEKSRQYHESENNAYCWRRQGDHLHQAVENRKT